MCEQRTILLVDDDHDLIRGMKLRFDAAGYKIHVAHSVESGVDAARKYRPQAIVMDLRLSDGSGLDAIATLKQDSATNSIPIVTLSGCVAAERQALDQGSRFFVRKPFRGRQVLNAVESAIEETANATTFQ